MIYKYFCECKYSFLKIHSVIFIFNVIYFLIGNLLYLLIYEVSNTQSLVLFMGIKAIKRVCYESQLYN